MHLQGRLLGAGTDNRLPTIAIVAHYDAAGLIPVCRTDSQNAIYIFNLLPKKYKKLIQKWLSFFYIRIIIPFLFRCWLKVQILTVPESLPFCHSLDSSLVSIPMSRQKLSEFTVIQSLTFMFITVSCIDFIF